MMISHLMSSNVVIASPLQSLKSAAQIMEENDFDALPICDDHRVIGMLTVKDIAMKAVAHGLSLEESRISDFMTFEAKYVFADHSTEYVIHFMAEQQLRRLLVLDRDYQLVGIVSLDDLVTASELSQSFPAYGPSSDSTEPNEWSSQNIRPLKQSVH